MQSDIEVEFVQVKAKCSMVCKSVCPMSVRRLHCNWHGWCLMIQFQDNSGTDDLDSSLHLCAASVMDRCGLLPVCSELLNA